MKQMEFKVSFNTPAFLGNAEQSAQWRTPPFKALLRQWWRVAYAADHGFLANVANMRHEEGVLFGHAWLEEDHDAKGRQVAARRSLVRLRMDRWDDGKLKRAAWPADLYVTHPEVRNREGRPVLVGSALYQGFGPLAFDNQRRTTTLKANAAIQSGEAATFSIAFPTTHREPHLRLIVEANAPRIEHALWLIDRYGTVGGRSRNGWGSFSLVPTGDTPALAGKQPARPWRDALGLDWPHAIGADGTPLIWQTQPFGDWNQIMRELARIKIGLRTQFVFGLNIRAGDRGTQRGIIHGQPQDRHWISFPVTNHSVQPWGRNARLPNSLRFKVRLDASGRLVGVIFHVPCLPPDIDRRAFNAVPHRRDIENVWQRVHHFLDGRGGLTRIPE